jgi:hypothetical protein
MAPLLQSPCTVRTDELTAEAEPAAQVAVAAEAER